MRLIGLIFIGVLASCAHHEVNRMYQARSTEMQRHMVDPLARFTIEDEDIKIRVDMCHELANRKRSVENDKCIGEVNEIWESRTKLRSRFCDFNTTMMELKAYPTSKSTEVKTIESAGYVIPVWAKDLEFFYAFEHMCRKSHNASVLADIADLDQRRMRHVAEVAAQEQAAWNSLGQTMNSINTQNQLNDIKSNQNTMIHNQQRSTIQDGIQQVR